MPEKVTGEIVIADWTNGVAYGLLQQWSEFDLGTSVGDLIAPQGQRFYAVVAVHVGYRCILPDPTLEFDGYFGPPTGIYILQTDGTRFEPSFGTAVGLIGLPPTAYLIDLDESGPVTIGFDQSAFKPVDSSFRAYVESQNPHMPFLWQLQTAISIGNTILIFAGRPKRYISFLPFQTDYLNGEWVYLYDDWEAEDSCYVISANIAYSQMAPLRNIKNGSWVVGGSFVVLVAGGWRWIPNSDFSKFQGALMPGGWVKFAGVLEVGSIEVEFDQESPYYRFNPTGTRIKEYLPYRIVAFGSVRRRPIGYGEIVIDKGYPIPKAVVVTYQTGSPLASLWAPAPPPTGSALIAQCCIAYPIYVQYYPDCSIVNYFDAIAEDIANFASLPSFKILVDPQHGPFVTKPINDFHVLSYVWAWEPLGSTSAGLVGTTASVTFQPISYGYNMPTPIKYERHLDGYWLSDIRNFRIDDLARPSFCTGFRMLPVWPRDIDPWWLTGDYGDPWRDDEFVDFTRGDIDPPPVRLFNPIPSFNIPEDRLITEMQPPAFFYHEIWRLKNLLDGGVSFFGSYSTGIGEDYWWLPLGTERLNPMRIVPFYAASFIRHPTWIENDWRFIIPEIKHSIVTHVYETSHGELHQICWRVDKTIRPSLMQTFLRREWYLLAHRTGDAGGFPLGRPYGYDWIPTSYVFENEAQIFASMSDFFPQTFLAHGPTPAERIPVIIGRFGVVGIFGIYSLSSVVIVLPRGEKRVIEFNESYRFRSYTNLNYFENAVQSYLARITRGDIYANPPVVKSSTIVVRSAGWMAMRLTNYGWVKQPLGWLYHPAPAPYVVLGKPIDCGSLIIWAGSMRDSSAEVYLWEPIERTLLNFGSVFPALGTFEVIGVFKGEDWTVRSQFVADFLETRPNDFDWIMSAPARYRWPAYYHVYTWAYDNPHNTPLPTTGTWMEKRITYPVPPIPQILGSLTVYNSGTTDIVALGSNYPEIPVDSARLILPFEGWIKTLPAGVIKRIPSRIESFILYGTKTFLDNEVLFMRRIVTMGNVPVTLYPTYAVYPGRIVYYFTQHGGECPLWMGEPILGVDGFPLDTGEIAVSVFTTRGVISFLLTIAGVKSNSWSLDPIPAWYSKLLRGR